MCVPSGIGPSWWEFYLTWGHLKEKMEPGHSRKKNKKLFPHYPGNWNKHISIPQLVPRLPVQSDGETGASWNFHGCYDRTSDRSSLWSHKEVFNWFVPFPLRCFPAPLPDRTCWACLNSWDASLNPSSLWGQQPSSWWIDWQVNDLVNSVGLLTGWLKWKQKFAYAELLRLLHKC